MTSYLSGFLLSCLLTFGAYFAVAARTLPPVAALILIGFAYTLQTVVQFVSFLRLGEDAEEEKMPLFSFKRWSFNFFLFTIFIALIVVIGSLWIMVNLNYRM